MEIKYTVEVEVSDEVIKTLAAAHLNLDDLVQTKIETALFPLTKGAILIYRADEQPKLINRFKTCPACNHPWPFHFSQTGIQKTPMDDGSMGLKEVLIDPVPTKCSECECMEAMK